MITRLVLLGGISLAFFGTALAQPFDPPRAVNDGVSPGRVVAMVRATGFEPVIHPVRKGDTYVLRALGPNQAEYRIVVDAHSGRTMSVRGVPAEAGWASRPLRGPVYGRIFAPPADDGYGSLRPPRDVPRAQAPPQTSTDSQSSPNATPLPRPRPYVMEATGSIPIGT